MITYRQNGRLFECKGVDNDIEVEFVVEGVQTEDTSDELGDFVSLVGGTPLDDSDYVLVKSDEGSNGVLRVKGHYG